jgi:hypothetical protein
MTVPLLLPSSPASLLPLLGSSSPNARLLLSLPLTPLSADFLQPFITTKNTMMATTSTAERASMAAVEFEVELSSVLFSEAVGDNEGACVTTATTTDSAEKLQSEHSWARLMSKELFQNASKWPMRSGLKCV